MQCTKFKHVVTFVSMATGDCANVADFSCVYRSTHALVRHDCLFRTTYKQTSLLYKSPMDIYSVEGKKEKHFSEKKTPCTIILLSSCAIRLEKGSLPGEVDQSPVRLFIG